MRSKVAKTTGAHAQGLVYINCNVSGTPTDIPRLHSDGNIIYPATFAGPNRCWFEYPTVTPPAGWGANIWWGTNDFRIPVPLPLKPGAYEASSLGIPTLDYGIPVPPYPPTPSRKEVLGAQISFLGGVIVDSPVYSKMPWWPSCLSWCDEATRRLSYDAVKAAGDTHVIIQIPNGLPLYNEWGQFYSPDKFGPLDWTNGETTLDGSPFSALVDEVIKENLKFIINMDERQPNSTRIVQLVMRALTDKQAEYGFTMPGYDGVFYGWPNDQMTIPAWAYLARQIKPNVYLGIEHNVGHIPLGNGPADYGTNGLMSGYDVILGEFGVDDSIHNDATWQVLGRMIRPYNRPPDQPSGDDPNPPFYLSDSPRGPRYYNTFETWDPYHWVRIDPNNNAQVNTARARIANDRAYFKLMGSKYLG